MTLWARILVWAVVLAVGAPAWGQDGPPAGPAGTAPEGPALTDPDPALATPIETLSTFVGAMAEYNQTEDGEAIERAIACCDLSRLPTTTDATQREAVAKLYGIILRIGFDRGEAFAWPSDTDGGRWRFFPSDDHHPLYRKYRSNSVDLRVDLERDATGAWRFSADTMAHVDETWRHVEGEPIRMTGRDVAVTLGQRLRAMMPAKLRTGTFAGVEYWQWLAILVVVLAGVALDYLVRGVLAAVWRRYRATHKRESDREVVKKAVRPFGLLVAALFWLAMLNLGGLPVLVTKVLIVATKVVLGFAGVWAAFRVTDLLAHVARQRATRTRTRIDDLLIPLVERTLKVFFCAMGVIYIADSFQVEILPLLTGLGIGGLAVAFAAKDTIENFFGSVAVIMDRPFEVGDWIEVGDVEGTVETMGLRSTRIRTFYNSLVTMPNASLVRATVDNYGKRRYRRFKTYLNITYDTPPAKIEAFCEGIRELIRLHPMTRKDYYLVQLNQFGAHSLDILLYCFHECPDWNIELRERHRLMLDIIRLADRLGVQFAFPTQTLHVLKEEHGVGHEPAPAPGADAEASAHELALAEVKRITSGQRWMDERPGPVEFGSAKTR